MNFFENVGKNKLARFAENRTLANVIQPTREEALNHFNLKGKWRSDFFKNNNPIVLELGCGKGEYTVGMAKAFPEKNFIGIDIKGARMWSGAKESMEQGMTNVAFLRTHIELISHFFAANEVSEIWITFPDPQMKKVSKRLTSTRFMKLYRELLAGDGIIHLKTDSNFMFQYTCEMVKANNYPVLCSTDDLYHSGMADDILGIRTYYEQQWLDRGLNIKYIKFVCEERNVLTEPDVEIELDPYRSFNRSKRSALASGK